MYEVFFKQLNSVIAFTEEEEEIFRGYLMPKKLRRN